MISNGCNGIFNEKSTLLSESSEQVQNIHTIGLASVECNVHLRDLRRSNGRNDRRGPDEITLDKRHILHIEGAIEVHIAIHV